MRMILRIEDSAEMTHITTVSMNRMTVSAGVIKTGSAESAVSLTMKTPMTNAMPKPTIALSSAWVMITV